jgi:hypothetical protein
MNARRANRYKFYTARTKTKRHHKRQEARGTKPKLLSAAIDTVDTAHAHTVQYLIPHTSDHIYHFGYCIYCVYFNILFHTLALFVYLSDLGGRSLATNKLLKSPDHEF